MTLFSKGDAHCIESSADATRFWRNGQGPSCCAQRAYASQAAFLELPVSRRERTLPRAALHLWSNVEFDTDASSRHRARNTGLERRELGSPTRSLPLWPRVEDRVRGVSWSRLTHPASLHCIWDLHSAFDAPIGRWLSERFSRNHIPQLAGRLSIESRVGSGKPVGTPHLAQPAMKAQVRSAAWIYQHAMGQLERSARADLSGPE